MPRQDFRCPSCGGVFENVWYPMPRYDTAHNRIDQYPECPAQCRTILDLDAPDDPVEMEPFPRQMAHDLLTGGLGLQVDDAAGRSVSVSSLGEIRTIEKESLRRAANGDGSPLVFRGFSQDAGNRTVNTLKGSSYERNRQIPLKDLRRGTNAGPITAKATTDPSATSR